MATTHAQGVNREQGTVTIVTPGSLSNEGLTVTVQLADEQILLLAAGVLARQAGYFLAVGTA